MIGFPFDSHVTYDDDGNPVYDRAITSEPYRKLLKELFSTGIMPTKEDNMKVVAGEGMNVIVKAGFAMVEGLMKLEERDRTLALQAADSEDRIDTVVLRLDDNDAVRECDFYIVKGIPSSSPTRPTLTREGSIYEIGLADIFITQNSTSISDEKITDTRYEDERCGTIDSINRLNDLIPAFEEHVSDEVRHITASERTNWNNKPSLTASQTDITAGSTALETGQLYVVYE